MGVAASTRVPGVSAMTPNHVSRGWRRCERQRASKPRPPGGSPRPTVAEVRAQRASKPQPPAANPPVQLPDVTSAPTLPREGLSQDASGQRVPTAWERARRRVDLEDPVVGWSASIGLTLLALFLRLWKLGTPKAFEFDETY